MKLWERVIEGKLRKGISILENQFSFMPGRSPIEAIHLIRRLIEVYRDRKKDPRIVFIDLKKAYDRVPREVLWKCLKKKGVSVSYIRAIKDMYEGVKTSVKSSVGDTEYFPISYITVQLLAYSYLLLLWTSSQKKFRMRSLGACCLQMILSWLMKPKVD